MKRLFILFVLFLGVNTIYSQEYSVFLFQKQGQKVYIDKSNGDKLFNIYLKNYTVNNAQELANSFKGERGVKDVSLSSADNDMYKLTLTLYKYADNPRYYWFLLKRNHVTEIETPQNKFSIDNYFDIHDKIKLK